MEGGARYRIVPKRVLALSAIFILIASSFIGLYTAPASAECLPFPTQSQVTVMVTVPSSGDYRLWLRQQSPASGNPIFVKVDTECPLVVSKNETPGEFGWVGSHEPKQPLVFNLSEGSHTLVLAGNQTGVQVDKGLLTADRDCVPEGTGQNCLQTKPPVEGSGVGLTVSSQKVAISSSKIVWLWVILIAAVGLLSTLGFLVWRYHGFIKRVILPNKGLLANGAQPRLEHITQHAFKLDTLKHFVAHHRVFAAACGAVLALFIASLTLGIVNAQNQALFEIEQGTLTGDASIDSGTGAVLFGAPAVVVNNNNQQNQNNSNTPNPNPGNNDNTPTPGGDDDEDPGNGGGGGTLPGECPAWPQFPDENCTGWRHTGVTLHECETDNGYIWDSNLTFDSCYFPQPLTIYGSNITITRSQVHGTITPHWSKNYDFGNLTLRDVEIEQEGVDYIDHAAVAGHNYTCTRCNVHHTISGMHFGNNVTIRDSYTHDFQWRDGAHGAGIGTGQDHGSNSNIIHNNIQCNRISGPPICSSALSIYPEDDNGDGITLSNVQVEKNLFNATGAYCVYAVSIPGSNINFLDNYFGKKFYPGCAGYGPVTGYGPQGGQWINNIWADGSGPVVPS